MKWIKTFESFDEDSLIDIENIESAFLSLKDELDLVKMSYDQFYDCIVKPRSLNSYDGFDDSYMIEYSKGKGYLRVQVTLFIKSNRDFYKKNKEVSENLKNEYPNLLLQIKDFIFIVEESENLSHYLLTTLREGSDFYYYHINISFYSKKSYIRNESIKLKNITSEDVIKTIKGGGRVFATIIKDFPNNDPKEPLTPVSIDDDGLVTVEYDGKEYEVDLEDIEKIDIPG